MERASDFSQTTAAPPRLDLARGRSARDVFLGIDVGSTTVKVAVLDGAKKLLAHTYRRAHGRPRRTLLQALEILAPLADTRIAGVGFTGIRRRSHRCGRERSTTSTS